MRESCIRCVQKHLGQAVVLLIESRMGYAVHRILAIGHLAEAEAESLIDFEDLAHAIREERKKIEEDIDYNPDIMSLITDAMAIEIEIGSGTEGIDQDIDQDIDQENNEDIEQENDTERKN